MAPADPTTPDADRPAARSALELRGSAAGLLDEPFALRVRGAGAGARLVWRARYRDDDGRVWRAAGLRCEDLAADWSPAKDGTGHVAALRSLRAVSIDLRVEAADGRGAARTLTRAIAADGVRTRRWRDGLAATLHVPAEPTPCATLLVDATAGDAAAGAAAVAAALLASRGVLVLVVAPGRGRDAAGDRLVAARERLAAVPGAAAEIVAVPALDPLGDDPIEAGAAVVLPPNAGVRGPAHAAIARAAAWDALLARLGARPRASVTS